MLRKQTSLPARLQPPSPAIAGYAKPTTSSLRKDLRLQGTAPTLHAQHSFPDRFPSTFDSGANPQSPTFGDFNQHTGFSQPADTNSLYWQNGNPARNDGLDTQSVLAGSNSAWGGHSQPEQWARRCNEMQNGYSAHSPSAAWSQEDPAADADGDEDSGILGPCWIEPSPLPAASSHSITKGAATTRRLLRQRGPSATR